MRNIKMIVSDLDNTLLRNDKSLSDYSKRIICMCCEQGVLFSFATARPERATRHIQTCIPVAYVIADNGASIASGGICIYSESIPENIKNRLIEELAAEKKIIGITVETGRFLYTNDQNHHKWSSTAEWNPVYNDFSSPIEDDVLKISVECEQLDIVRSIIAEYSNLSILPNSGENWIQIVRCSSSKYNAIAYICERNGIGTDCVLAFGDDYNDVEMLNKCGIGVAVANAIPEAKRASDFICETNEEDGVAKYLERNFIST